MRRPSARDSKKSRLESKPPTMGSAGVPPLVSSKQGEPSSRFLQSPDLLQASPVSFRSLTLVVDRDLTQPGWMRQSLIPITLKWMPEKRPETALLRKGAGAGESRRQQVGALERAAERLAGLLEEVFEVVLAEVSNHVV